MDDLDNTSNLPNGREIPPYPDFSSPPPHSGGVLKWIVLLILVALIGGFIFMGGGRSVINWYQSQPTLFQNTTKIQEYKAASPFASLTLPPSVRMIGVYHAPFKDKGLDVFLAAAEKDPRVLPKEFLSSLQLGAHSGAVYYLMAVKDSAVSIDQNMKTLVDNIHQQGATTHIQDQIWIAEKPVDAAVDEIVRDGKTFQLVSMKLTGATAFLSVTPEALVEKSPNRDVIASLTQTQSTAVSFLPPEPAGVKWARAAVSSDEAERKKAVPMLATLGGPQPEAVAFLADEFPKQPDNVQVDVVAALGLLAPTTPQAVQPLIVALGDASARQEAMAALGSLGASAKAALPALKKIALNKRESKSARLAANTAIAKITGRPLRAAASKRKRRR
jgi:hypothetical protein